MTWVFLRIEDPLCGYATNQEPEKEKLKASVMGFPRPERDYRQRDQYQTEARDLKFSRERCAENLCGTSYQKAAEGPHACTQICVYGHELIYEEGDSETRA